MDRILSTIRSGDVILTRWDKYVTSMAVPGFWSHCGLVTSKKKVIHAALDGVRESHILDFLRVDHVMVLRPGSGMFSKKAVARARMLVGKDYDYLFDGLDDKAIYCFELIHDCYPRIEAKKRILAEDIIETDGFEMKFDSRGEV